MTPAQALAVMVLLRGQLASHQVVGVDGLEFDFGQLMVAAPSGVTLSVAVPLPHPLPLTRAELRLLREFAESRIRELMTPYETDAGRGFNSFGRGTHKPGVPGYSATDGAV